MNQNEFIKEIIQRPEYDFLKTNTHLGGKLMFLALGGSHAYGTSTETSDIDIRGVAFNSKSDLLGLSEFDQYDETKTDTVVYGFNKFIKLAMGCNPNIIEMLGQDSYYVYKNDVMRLLLDHRKLFLSKRAVHSFGGYANQQLTRMINACSRRNHTDMERAEYVADALTRFVSGTDYRYTSTKSNAITFGVKPCLDPNVDLDNEVVCTITGLVDYPVREITSILSEMKSVNSSYTKANHRGKKKDNAHLNKHAMHLVRLYLMAFDILEKEEIITYRGDDIEFLMSIRNGKYQKADGSYDDEFFDLVNEYDKRLKYAADNTSLPKDVDKKQIEELVMTVNEWGIKYEQN